MLLSTSADATMTENNGINDEQPQPNIRPRLESEQQLQELQYWANSPDARQVFKPITVQGYSRACLLEVGQTQSFVLKADYCGPWYLSPGEQDLQQHSKATGRSKLVK